ncbi:MAG: hypothetical protein JW913_08845 [Chitinispirillaceae bacterium]|nr:hypothetical protein [Chitinispirillaceae bacterium]
MRKALILILAAGSCIGSYATDARVNSWGKHDAFFMDEVSIFRNPANISIYPNMVYGSYGKLTVTDSAPFIEDPFFGGIVSYSLNEESDAGGQYPMLSLGAVFNRYDEMLDYVTKGKADYLDTTVDLAKPLGKLDLLLGYVFKNGVMLGGGAYLALQSKEKEGELYETKIYKGNVGMNWPVAKTMDLEISLGGGTMTAVSANTAVARQDYFGRAEIRLFSALAGINGDFVPRARVDFLNLEEQNELKVDIAAGLGMNINIDKGFFWAGLEFLYGQRDAKNNEAEQNVGGKISFGIERNVLWDWFLIRVGGQKSLLLKTVGPSEKEWWENPSSDETDKDLVGLGFGINIDNRLHLDFVVSEMIPFTCSNLISGEQKYLFSRVSATYSF